ncbi:hypothetical protein H9Q16_00960 [Sulfitobacter sp. TSTF-M16]|uniref:Uncharacterized protein n=1 Tax=Sulfitobacter aestuariivivens TaxID=2766981 RepID=A0A927HDN6_9RHOB|nr:hypothetical protein [Sulfitobacter aestuariivivens]MBD3662484.1 hypothetical protein [Sulfitobacter aestuariivivens]
MLSRAFALSALCICAGAAVAQQQISPEAFLDRAEGKTFTFRQYQGNAYVGTEQFLRRDLSVWATSTGRCTYGTITVRGPQVCFLYDDFPDPENCWLPFEYNGDLVVMAPTGEVQRVTKITERPISCEGAPVS